MRVDPLGALVASPDRDRAVSPWLWVVVRALALGVVYAAIYKLIDVETSFGTSVGSTFWPASGVTVWVLIVRPGREWPLYVAAIAFADFMMDVHSAGFTPRVAFGLAAANCAEPLLSASLLRAWLCSRPDLTRLRDLGLFYVAAAVCGPLLSATISAIWSSVLGSGGVWPFIGRWYVGDALGVIIVAPFLLSLARPRTWLLVGRSQAWPFAILLGAVAVALPWGFDATVGLPFMVIPALSLIGIRLGTRAAVAAVLIVGALVEILTAIGSGPFAGSGSFDGLLSAQMYLVACSASGLTAAALMTSLVARDQMAMYDSLTGLANRWLLIDRISVACRHLRRTPGAVGVMLIDLDQFKPINDEYGHAVGDRVLIETSRRLQSVVRAEDTVARIGGDEFVILVGTVADAHFLPALARRVEQVVAEPIVKDEITIRIGASVGYAITERHDEGQEALLTRADNAMYAVKRTRGRDLTGGPFSPAW